MTETESRSAEAPKIFPLQQVIWLPVAVFAGLVFAVAAGIYSSRSMMLKPTANAAQLGTAQNGQTLEVAVEITAVPAPNLLEARLLDKQGTDYRRSGTLLHVHLGAGTALVMGKQEDLRPGAVLQVSAASSGADKTQLDARQLVVLTGYVQVH